MESSRSAQRAKTQRRPCKLKAKDTAAEYQSWRQKAKPTVKTAHGPALNKTKNSDSIATKGSVHEPPAEAGRNVREPKQGKTSKLK